MEEKKIAQLLSIESNVEILKQELNNIIDLESVSFEVKFVPFESFIVDSEFNATKHDPEAFYMLEGNVDSKQMKMPSNGFTMTTMLRARKEQTAYYLDMLSKIGTKVLFIRPYIYGSTLRIFTEALNGGWHLNVCTLSENDFRRIGRPR